MATKWYDTRRQPFREGICAMCGKKYIKPNGSLYRVIFAGRTNSCCSWTCYNKARRTKAAHNEHQYADLLREQRESTKEE